MLKLNNKNSIYSVLLHLFLKCTIINKNLKYIINGGIKLNTKLKNIFCLLIVSTVIFSSLRVTNVFAKELDAPVNLQVPTLAYDDTTAVLVWEKPENYSNIKYFNVYKDGNLIGNTDYTNFTDSDSRAFQNISAFYNVVDEDSFHTKILIHNYTVYGLESDTEYSFYVTSVGYDGLESGFSNAIKLKTAPKSKEFNIKDFGAVEGNTEDNAVNNTKFIQNAIDEASFYSSTLETSSDNKNVKVVVPPGVWVTGSIWLKSDVTLEIQKDATLLGSLNEDLYPKNFWVYDYSTDERAYALINAHTYDYGTLKNIRIVGQGIIDGNGWLDGYEPNEQVDLIGNSLMGYPNGGVANVEEQGKLAANQVKQSIEQGFDQQGAYNTRSNLITFRGVNGVYVEGITVRGASFHGFVNLQSENIVYNNTISDTYNINNADGFEFGDSKNIMVFNNFIHTGDDGVNFAAGMGEVTTGEEPTGNAWIFNNYMQEGHGGAVTGSHTGAWIEKILTEDNILNGTETGLRAKTNTPMGGGARDIVFRDNVLENISGDSPFIFTSAYTDANATIAYEPAQNISYFTAFLIENCTVRNYSKKSAIKIEGNSDIKEIYHNNFFLKNIKFDNVTKPAEINYGKNIKFEDVVITNSIDDFWKITNSQNIVFENTSVNGVLTQEIITPEWGEDSLVTIAESSLDDLNITMYWDEPSNTEIETYIVFVDGKDLGKGNIVTSKNEISLSTENEFGAILSPYLEHMVEIYAQDKTGARTVTPLKTIIPKKINEIDEIAPTLPVNTEIKVEAQPGYTWVAVSWEVSTDNDVVSHYDISLNNEKNLVPIESLSIMDTTAQYILTGLEPGTEYNLVVKAVDAIGNESEEYTPAIFNTRLPYASTVPSWNSNELDVIVEEIGSSRGNIILSWEPAIVEPAQKIIGYRIYLNGKVIQGFDQDIANPINDVLTISDTVYTINDVDLTKDIYISIVAGSSSEKLSKRDIYTPVEGYRWGGVPLNIKILKNTII